MNEDNVNNIEVLEEVSSLRIQMNQLIKGLNDQRIQTRIFESNELDQLFAALSNAQLNMEVAKTENINPFFKSKYADLATIVKASRPYLAKSGLSVIQRIIDKDEKMFLLTRLCHSSGQWIEEKMPINPDKTNIQAIGSYITYLRRYCYAAIVGVVASGEDDDGEKAMEKARNTGIGGSNKCISKSQLEVLSIELEKDAYLLDNLLKGYNIKKLAELPASKYTSCLNRIREIKKSKND